MQYRFSNNSFGSRKIYIILPAVLLFFLFCFFFPFTSSVFTSEKLNEVLPHDSLVTATITVVGDIMCHSVQFNYARVEGDSFNFNPVYREIRRYLICSDFLFGNFETVAAGKSKKYSGYPFFNAPDDFVTALKANGFDLLTTSNNHSLDQGEKGLLRTLEVMKKKGLRYNGTFISKEDRDSIRIFNIKNMKIAFLAYTYGTNGNPVPKGKSYLINLIDLSLIENDIKAARRKGAEIVIIHYHFGEEYKRDPSDFQKEIVKKSIGFGADIIIGGHPHVLQPAVFYKTSNAVLDSGFVIYSMGNFISNQRWRYSDAGIILNISLTKDLRKDSVYISKADYIPTWVFKGKTDRGPEYVIIPLLPGNKSGIEEYLSQSDRNSVMQSFEDCNYILTRYTKRIELFHETLWALDVVARGYEHKGYDLTKNSAGRSLFNEKTDEGYDTLKIKPVKDPARINERVPKSPFKIRTF